MSELVFQKEELPHRLEPYQREAERLTQQAFSEAYPQPVLLFARTTLWDPLLLITREQSSGNRTAVASYEEKPGGVSFVSPIKKRNTDPESPHITLGRDRTNDLVVPVPSVSAHHCRFTPPSSEDPTWTCADLGARNGSFLDDTRMVPSEPYSVTSGCRLEIGGELRAFFYEPADFWVLLREEEQLEALINQSSS